jgi:hypothetical protein
MTDASDIDLYRADEPAPPPPPPGESRSTAAWIAGAIALVAALALGWYFFGRGAPPIEPTPAPSEAAVPPPSPSSPGLRPTLEMPPLDQSDPIVRMLVGALSSHPRVTAWLANTGLIRNFTVSVVNIAEGNIPAAQLRVLRPVGRFQIIESPGRLRIDPRGFARYDALADAVSSIDPIGAAQLYVNVKPRVDEAYAELGIGTPFDATLEHAIVMLLRAPVLEGDVALASKGGLLAFEDQRIEMLPAAQKQLTRMGPRNARMIQQRLRQIARALAIPADRLP